MLLGIGRILSCLFIPEATHVAKDTVICILKCILKFASQTADISIPRVWSVSSTIVSSQLGLLTLPPRGHWAMSKDMLIVITGKLLFI